MSISDWQELCDSLDAAIDDQRSRDKARQETGDETSSEDATWYVLMAARRVAFVRLHAAKYPDAVVRDPEAWQAVAAEGRRFA